MGKDRDLAAKSMPITRSGAANLLEQGADAWTPLPLCSARFPVPPLKQPPCTKHRWKVWPLPAGLVGSGAQDLSPAQGGSGQLEKAAP